MTKAVVVGQFKTAIFLLNESVIRLGRSEFKVKYFNLKLKLKYLGGIYYTWLNQVLKDKIFDLILYDIEDLCVRMSSQSLNMMNNEEIH